jgi:hypothetical protein
MTERLDKLVALYAKQSVEQLKNDPTLLKCAFGKSHDELAREWGFSEDQEFVESLALFIESRREKLATPDHAQQIAECLKMLLQIAMYDKSTKSTRDFKIETLSSLIGKMFSAGWSSPQKEHFAFVKEKVKCWNSYFISYTNDGAKVTNDIYKAVIELYVDPAVTKQLKPEEDNLLVEAIINRLGKRLLVNRSFYDKRDIKLGDDLNGKIGPACKNTFTFVQLVQLETFDMRKPLNWCFEEYRLFHKGNEDEVMAHTEYREVFRKRFCALLAGETPDHVRPPCVPFEYEAWSSRIFAEQRRATLPKTTGPFDDTIAELAQELIRVKYQIMENVPA